MKRIILSLILLLFVLNLFSQPQTNSNYSRDHYLVKSKNQKKVATILLAGGAASILTGALIPKGESEGGFNPFYKNDGIKFTFVGIGTLSMLASIPFYIASSKNKRRANAAKLSFNNQKVIFIQQNTFVLKTQPTLTLSYKFPG
jgi:uncharacterized protein YxeA